MIGITLFSSACNHNTIEKNPTKAALTIPTLQPFDFKVIQFLQDANIPTEVFEKFETAIQGDKKAREWLDTYDDEHQNQYYPAITDVFPYRNIQKADAEKESYYHIGMLYYNGNKDIPLKQSREKAFYWLQLSAEKGSFSGAILAGDMAQSGDGISMNQKAAFDFYEKALKNEINGIAYERLAYCYENGIGTQIDDKKAKDYYFKSTLDGNEKGLYKLADSDELSFKQSILFSKAASSMDYSAPYFEMVYEGGDGYTADESKLQVIKCLGEAWENGTDPAAVQLKESITGNKYFPKEFVEELVKTSYTYSYHTFAPKYGVNPNRSLYNGKNIPFEEDEGIGGLYLENEDSEYYELDFDGDGTDEIGFPMLSGAGGAFMTDGFGIFKKNNKGFYKDYAFGPACTLRDGMRLINYNDRIYFITNPYSDTMNEPHDITARVIDKHGKGHELCVLCNQYKPKEIMTQVYDDYHKEEFAGFLSEVMSQTYEAISATKRHEMYNPNRTVILSDEPQDVYFAADINNDKVKEYIRKGHMIDQGKYYNDYHLFQIYDGEGKLTEEVEPSLELLPDDGYYGLHSTGNLYDRLPVGGKIVQFWTVEKDNKTYCIALTRNELLYGLHIVTIQNEKAIPVCDSLFFDEVQDIDIQFSKD